MTQPIETFTLGLVFDQELTHALLVHKLRPDWQKGRVNGIGGKREASETITACMTRECEEETALIINEANWIRCGTIHQSAGNVAIFATRYSGNYTDACTNDHEKVEWFPINTLPETVMDNLHWIIPMCRRKLLGDKFRTVAIFNE